VPRRAPAPGGDLADGRRCLVDGVGDLVVAEVEHVAQHEHRPLRRRQRLQHQQHRHRHAVGQHDVLGHVRRGQQRLGQPWPDVRLLAAAEGAQPGQRLPGGDPDQVCTPVAHHVKVDAGPAQPRLLQHVFRVGGRAEHLVRDGEQQVPVGDESVRGGVHPLGPPVSPPPVCDVISGPPRSPRHHQTPQSAVL
jgi:hypothetical protein